MEATSAPQAALAGVTPFDGPGTSPPPSTPSTRRRAAGPAAAGGVLAIALLSAYVHVLHQAIDEGSARRQALHGALVGQAARRASMDTGQDPARHHPVDPSIARAAAGLDPSR